MATEQEMNEEEPTTSPQQEREDKTREEDKTLAQIRSLVKTGRLIIGTREVMKASQKGLLQKVVLASNCPIQKRKDVQKYAALVGIPVIELKHNNEELGILCKKNFLVAMIGLQE